MRTRRTYRSLVRIALIVALWAVPGMSRCLPADEHEPPPAAASETISFENTIAPLLARHCLECHDGRKREGGLDLSHKQRAFKGGDGGRAIEAGDSDGSLIWQYVESDEMPKDRAALSDYEKSLLKSWIDAGAEWTVETIDAEAYRNTQGTAIWLQRLTVPEYIETVRSTVGVDIEKEARGLLPRDQRADGFTNTAYNLGVDLAHVEAYERLARLIVSRMDVPAFASQHAECSDLNDECLQEVIRKVGKRLFRGPLRDEEVQSFLKVSHAVKEAGGNFDESVAYVLQAMLQSPRFLFRIEQQRGDGTPQPVNDYELASRLSYILWGAPPDEALLELADAGKLNDAKVIARQVQRMLEDQRAQTRSVQFIAEWLHLERLESLQPNPTRFPEWSPQLAADMRTETEQFFQDLVWKQDRPLWDLLNAQFTYATPRLAHHYGLFADAVAQDSDSETVSRVDGGLQALYRFREGRGDLVRDVSGAGHELDLRIADDSGVRWKPQGLEIHAGTLLAAEKPASGLSKALKKSNAITLEAWITPADTVQSGPARILTLSNGISARNFTLGQDGDKFEVRLRTTETGGNGTPPAVSSASGSVETVPLHVVYTRNKQGAAAVYVNGRQSGKETVRGDFSNWDDRFLFAVGNELSKDRLWQGTLHLAAIYDRALSAEEVRQNHAAGAGVMEDTLSPHVVSAAWERADKQDLIALYRFDGARGDLVRNQADSGDALDLKIDKPDRVKWSRSGLSVYDSALIATPKSPRRLIDAVKKSKAFSLEAWVTPANTTQDGPARILTLSSGTGERNFTLGQERDRYDLRIRAARTDGNGMPSLAAPSGSASTELTHLVVTADSSGRARLYVNGQQQASSNVGGSFDKWSNDFRLAIANEATGDRPWLGTYHLVAIYTRALTPEEIAARAPDVARYDLAKIPFRGGLLTQGSVLTIGGDEGSMVARGLFVLHDLLDSRVGNPPASVDTTPIPTQPGMSMRDAAEARLADSSCSGCHVKFEPLAFGLEKFNGIGGHCEIDEHGNTLREDGEILLPDSNEALRYNTAAELMDLLAGSERVRLVLTRKLLQFSLGRPLNANDLKEAETIHEVAQHGGGTYRALMTAILTSDLIRKTRTEAE
jgi:hypothetical protein